MLSPEVSSGLAFVVITAISLWVLRENSRVLISQATILVSKDMSRIRSLALRQRVISKFTMTTIATFIAMSFADARMLHRHLERIGCRTAVYIFSRTRTRTRALFYLCDLSVV